jgi:hypothetical protein
VGHKVNREQDAGETEKHHGREEEEKPERTFAPALKQVIKVMTAHGAKL